ncbi:MAG: preprotein translocase subunit SecE [Absicoccus porci]|jgi:preprotein translocase subunit SecE|uniref:Preprotein translocase subunit SecE n=1 Tax=Absicoccus porci TaxID=2486576 RepID=A0A3N0I398_9FIRM|nr:preprotein translocase subunit SecE [Absicoccus porci]MCI6088273.1 preprotein translocase subunit SecE [Absicoccus porci]MDD6459726.1 preprotein translocase subunit SecE [Absicoccus porci]MDD7330356.1 preprotein translocase subunit SecE [Absicoccus porci]MDY4739198.1 preprotein translocase subunit SecE [Absicoccus porci]MEE1354787.1 preprotein translocase subunit SecE [Absicoccus porci]
MAKEKKEKKGWAYSPANVMRELKKVKWPSVKQLSKDSLLVIVFTLLFGLYFFVCEILSTGLVSKIVGK